MYLKLIRIGYLIICWVIFFYQFVDNFSALLLCKINVLDIFDTGNFFQIFVISRSTEILIESNFWLEMYVTYILKDIKKICLYNNNANKILKNQQKKIFQQIISWPVLFYFKWMHWFFQNPYNSKRIFFWNFAKFSIHSRYLLSWRC